MRHKLSIRRREFNRLPVHVLSLLKVARRPGLHRRADSPGYLFVPLRVLAGVLHPPLPAFFPVPPPVPSRFGTPFFTMLHLLYVSRS